MPVYSSISSQPSGESYTVFTRGYGRHSSPESLAKLDRQMPQPAARTKDHQLFVLLQGQIVIKPSQYGSSSDKQSPCLFGWYRGRNRPCMVYVQGSVFGVKPRLWIDIGGRILWILHPYVAIDCIAI